MTYGLLNPMLWGCSKLPVFDAARTRTYVNAITKDWMPCGADYGDLYPQEYTTPAEDRPWWVSDAHPESKLFAGFNITKVTGLYGPAPYERGTLRLASAGSTGRVSTWRKPQWQERTILVEGTAHGATCCSVDYGLRVLAEVMRGCCSDGCDGGCLRTLRPGGCATDPCGIIKPTILCPETDNVIVDGADSVAEFTVTTPPQFVLSTVTYDISTTDPGVTASSEVLNNINTVVDSITTFAVTPVVYSPVHQVTPPAQSPTFKLRIPITGGGATISNVAFTGYQPALCIRACPPPCTPGDETFVEVCPDEYENTYGETSETVRHNTFPAGFELTNIVFDYTHVGVTPGVTELHVTISDNGTPVQPATIITTATPSGGATNISVAVPPYNPLTGPDAEITYEIVGLPLGGSFDVSNIKWRGTVPTVCPEPELPNLAATIVSSPWVNLRNVAVAEGPEIIARGDDLAPCCGCSTTTRWRMVLTATDPRLYGDPALISEVTVNAAGIPCDIAGNCFNCDTVDSGADPTCIALPIVSLPDPKSCACIPPVTQAQFFDLSIPDTPFPVFATVTVRTAAQPIDGLQIRWWRKRPGMPAGHPNYTPCNACGGAVISHIEASSRLILSDTARLRKPGGVFIDATRRLYTPGGAPWPGAIELGCGEWIMEVRWGTTTDPSGTTIKIEVTEAMP